MTAPNAGSASVSIVPDLRGFAERLSSDLVPQAREIGDQIGRELGQAMYQQASDHIREISARLDALGAERVNVDVNVDDHGSAAATAFKVEAIGAAAGSSGSGGLSLMQSAILAFGPAAVGAAAAAIPAILAIGAAAAGAFAGIGVLALGFSGISNALQASQAPPSGGSGGQAQKQNQLAGAGLSQQQQQLAASQATQQAADQLTQAEHGVTDAENALSKAQRDSKQAQVDLSLARKQAAQDLVDLTNKVIDNGLAQRDATIKLDQARKNLAVVKAAPGAGLPQYADQVAAAQLAFDSAKQNLSELQTSGTRLADQKKTADAAGVNGAAAVVAAQRKVIDSQVALTKAQRDNIDAAHKLVEAQQNVATTQLKNALASQQAALSAANAGIAAAGGVNQFAAAMAKLNPIQQQFVEYLLKLKPLFDDLKLAASGFLPGLEKGISSILTVFGPIRDIVANVATALGDVFVNIGKGLASPEGRKFLTFLGTELPKQILFLGQLAVDFGKIFAGIFETFAPVIHQVDQIVLTFLNRLADKSLGGGFKAFVDAMLKIVPKVFDTLGAIADLIGKVFLAIDPSTIGASLDLLKLLAVELGKLVGPASGITKVWGDLITAVEPLVPLLGGIIQAVLPPLISLLDVVVKQGIVPLVTALVKDLTPYLPQFSAALGKITGALASLVPLLVQGFLQAVLQILPQMPQLLLALVNGTKAFADLVAAVSPLIPPLVQIISTGLLTTMIAEWYLMAEALIYTDKFLAGIIRTISNFIASVLRAITNTRQFGAELRSGFSSAVQAVIGFFTALPGRILSFVAGAASWLVSTGRAVISGLLSGLRGAVGGVTDFVSGLGGRVFNAVGNLAQLLYNVGRDIVGGLVRGIKDAWHTVIDSITGLASHLPGPLKKLFGISSPSRLFAEQIGAPIAQGIAVGITEKAGLSVAALANLGSQLSQFQAPVLPSLAFAGVPGFGAQAAGPGGGGSWSMTNHISGQSDPNATAHQVATRLWARGV